jgi:SpoVK/Ycf46/Vps4 family AAA+-type ATPase
MHLEEKGSFEKDNKYPSLNAWLNLLDRVEGEIIFWFTSNNYEKIQAFNDGALIRPGRIDNVIKFEKMTTEEVFSAWEYFKPNDPDIKIVKELNLNFDGVTIAQIINTLKQYLPLSVLAQTSQPS